MSDEKKIDEILSTINDSLDKVLESDKPKSEKVLSRLKEKLKSKVNEMVWEKPEGWKHMKYSYAEVLSMITEIENSL